MADLHTAATSAGGILERLLDEAEGVSDPEGGEPSAAPTPAAVGARTGDGNPLSALLGNPAVLSSLPALLENLSPLLTGGGRSPSAGGRSSGLDRHTALLCALKPYLSPHRRETAETIIHLCRLWDALERSGISLTGLSGLLGGMPSSREGGENHVQ